jgi:hypothetical protein
VKRVWMGLLSAVVLGSAALVVPGLVGAQEPPAESPTAQATLSADRRCPPRAFSPVRVRGRNIARVTFFVNGDRRLTLRQPNAGSSFRYRLRSRELVGGSRRVRARVAFRRATGAEPRNLSAVLAACAARFTG